MRRASKTIHQRSCERPLQSFSRRRFHTHMQFNVASSKSIWMWRIHTDREHVLPWSFMREYLGIMCYNKSFCKCLTRALKHLQQRRGEALAFIPATLEVQHDAWRVDQETYSLIRKYLDIQCYNKLFRTSLWHLHWNISSKHEGKHWHRPATIEVHNVRYGVFEDTFMWHILNNWPKHLDQETWLLIKKYLGATCYNGSFRKSFWHLHWNICSKHELKHWHRFQQRNA